MEKNLYVNKLNLFECTYFSWGVKKKTKKHSKQVQGQLLSATLMDWI